MRRGIRDPAWLAAVTRRAWSPLDLSPALWLDAADASTITDAGGGAVSEWRDKSGNARHFNQGTPANRPTTGARAQNGRNVIDFVRASSQFLDGGDILDLGTNAFSIFGVVKFDDTARACPWGKSILSTIDGRYGLYREGNVLNGVYDEGPLLGLVSVADTSLAARIVGQVLSRDVGAGAASHVLHVDDDITTKAFTDSAKAWNTVGPWRLGRYGTSTLFDHDGFLAEMVVVLRTMTPDEISSIKAYLKTKWGTA